jgi:hypothetical protein
MSLINEALKKAQRQRATPDAPGTMPATDEMDADRPAKRGKAMPAHTLFLIVIAAAVLVLLSVAATFFLLRPAPTPEARPVTPPVATASVAPPAATPTAETAPQIVVPAVKDLEPAPAPAAPPVAVNPAVQAPESAQPTPGVPGLPSEQAYAFLDKLQVTGIRFSGSDSKVLMNDRVYRVNDIVERSLGLKLVKVTANSLTFVDRNGATYTKNF